MGLTIGQLSKATGVKPVTIRFYEKNGLMGSPSRTGGNYRSYGSAELARLSFICRARKLGFNLDQVRQLLELADARGPDCSSVDGIAARHLEEVDRKLADLTALRRELAAVISSCSGGSVTDCRIIEALAPASQSPL